jgi:hypothetical protein
MRRVVDLPQPGGPDQHHELAVLDLEVRVVHRRHVAGVDLVDVFEKMPRRTT